MPVPEDAAALSPDPAAPETAALVTVVVALAVWASGYLANQRTLVASHRETTGRRAKIGYQ